MKLRTITSLTLLLSLGLVILTSLIMFIVPQGRVAYWSDWRLWGLNKTQWSELHLSFGLLMLLAALLHLYYNWKPILNYLKSRAKKVTGWNTSFGIALLLCVCVAAGTYFQIPPLYSIIRLSESIKESAAESYGEPPYGHAELSSLRMFTQKQDLDLEKNLALLRSSGLIVKSPQQSIVDIARQNMLSPKQVYEVIKPARMPSTTGSQQRFPASPPPGFGSSTLAEICATYGCDLDTIRQALAVHGIKAEADQSVKAIAAAHDLRPMAIFEVIRAALTEQ